MEEAIALAEKARGFTSPNPLVGAVIVKDGKIIGRGYHEHYGNAHAEVNAFLNATEDVAGATMFVTLEPCSHYGKTPPCALKIIEKKIKKVVIAKLDPNPLVYKNGVKMLEAANIEVEYGLLEAEASYQNEIFFHFIQHKRPYVAIKYAMTLDGKIATKDFDSKWITNSKSRAYVHDLRNQYQAILAGVNTIIKDDANLNVRRSEPSRQPIRIIIDPDLLIPHESVVVKTANKQPTWVVSNNYDQTLVDLGVRIIKMEEIKLTKLLDLLGSENIDSLFIEGGSFTHGSFLDEKLVNKVYAFIAPKLIGGKAALTPVSGIGVSLMKDAYELTNIKIKTFDEDILVEGEIKL